MLRVLGKNVLPHTTWTVNMVTSKILYHYMVSHQQVEIKIDIFLLNKIAIK